MIYAVKSGRKCGIFYDWDSCREQVDGFKGAKYMSFVNEADADKYLTSTDDVTICDTNSPVSDFSFFTFKDKKNIISGWNECFDELCKNNHTYFKGFNDLKDIGKFFDNNEHSEMEAYIDGSYKKETGEFSCGVVIMFNDSDGFAFYEKFNNSDFGKMNNVAGEIMGAVRAIQYAIDNNIYNLTLIHDYEGIEAWAKERWKAKNKYTQRYVEFYIESLDRVNIHFKKVKSHSGQNLNTLADNLAKTALK